MVEIGKFIDIKEGRINKLMTCVIGTFLVPLIWDARRLLKLPLF
jgi:hypothetical protein